MNTQTTQFFKGMLAFVMALILGAAIVSYLRKNYSSFEVETEAPPPDDAGGDF